MKSDTAESTVMSQPDQLSKPGSTSSLNDAASISTETTVVGDVDRLIQAVGNVVVASVEQSPENEAVVLRVRAEDPHVVFEIEDRGPAVPPEAVATFFDRLRKTGPRRRSSSSFGLAAARELVLAHGGKLTVETMPNGSTKFVATLPGA